MYFLTTTVGACTIGVVAIPAVRLSKPAYGKVSWIQKLTNVPGLETFKA
jgi:hypothetical protein